jgi:hypothetical protein
VRMTPSRAHELDSVRLTRAVDGRPPGTLGAVIREDADTALVEVVETEFDQDGLPVHGLFEMVVDVPCDALDVVQRGHGRPDPRSSRRSVA